MTDKRTAPVHSAGQLAATDLVLEEGEEEEDENNQLGCTTDISPPNLSLEASAIPPGKIQQTDLPYP